MRGTFCWSNLHWKLSPVANAWQFSLNIIMCECSLSSAPFLPFVPYRTWILYGKALWKAIILFPKQLPVENSWFCSFNEKCVWCVCVCSVCIIFTKQCVYVVFFQAFYFFRCCHLLLSVHLFEQHEIYLYFVCLFEIMEREIDRYTNNKEKRLLNYKNSRWNNKLVGQRYNM